jgi:hypothetical protein
MRTINDHRVNPANDRLTISVVDEPGSGGASHLYVVSGFDPTTNPSTTTGRGVPNGPTLEVLFQNGPIGEAGVNGVTHEALLAILIDRMRAFQAGPFSCRENALALTKLEEAQQWLQARTRGRMLRGVEGTHAA